MQRTRGVVSRSQQATYHTPPVASASGFRTISWHKTVVTVFAARFSAGRAVAKRLAGHHLRQCTNIRTSGSSKLCFPFDEPVARLPQVPDLLYPSALRDLREFSKEVEMTLCSTFVPVNEHRTIGNCDNPKPRSAALPRPELPQTWEERAA